MKIKNILLGTVVGSLSLCGLVSCDNDFLEEKSYEYTSSTSYNTPEELDMAIGFLHGRIQYLFFGVWGNHNYFMTGMGLETKIILQVTGRHLLLTNRGIHVTGTIICVK